MRESRSPPPKHLSLTPSLCKGTGFLVRYSITMLRKRGKTLPIILLFCLVLLLGKFLSNPLNSFFQKVFSPVEKYFWAKGQQTGTFFFYFFNAKGIYSENQLLKKQNAILSQKNNELISLSQENKELREAFDLGEKEGFSLLPCHIISKQAGEDTILVAKGSKDGLAQRMPVITASGILIGSIKKTNSNFSEVALITTKDFSFDVTVRVAEDPPSQAVALAKGEGNLSNLSLNYAEKTTPIPNETLVYTSSMGGNFPKGLLVGEMENVKDNPAELFQTGNIKPYFKKGFLDEVFIIQNFQSISD